MKRIISRWGLLLLGLIFSMNVSAQDTPKNEHPDGHPDMERRMPSRPTVFDLVSEIRKNIGLDQKEFDKVYSAYEKFNKSVFGDDDSNLPAGGPGMRPGGGGPGGGRMGGGPGGGMPGGGGPGGGRMGGGPGGHGGPSGAPQDMKSSDKKSDKNFDPVKFEKTKAKAEEKLCKAVKKVFKKEPEKYSRWLEMRNQQLDRLFPQPPHGGPAPDDNNK